MLKYIRRWRQQIRTIQHFRNERLFNPKKMEFLHLLSIANYVITLLVILYVTFHLQCIKLGKLLPMRKPLQAWRWSRPQGSWLTSSKTQLLIIFFGINLHVLVDPIAKDYYNMRRGEKLQKLKDSLASPKDNSSTVLDIDLKEIQLQQCIKTDGAMLRRMPNLGLNHTRFNHLCQGNGEVIPPFPMEKGGWKQHPQVQPRVENHSN